MTEAAVALRNVTKRFGTRTVVDCFSLQLARGGRVCLLGPSGKGKTTILRLIAGLDVPDEGEVWISGRLASSAGRLHVAPFRRNIGFVFQDLALWPHMTVAANLHFMLESRRWPAADRATRVHEMLTLVGLVDRSNEFPTHLSGGEQQRVALARALVTKPDLLLLDEPLSSLDIHLRRSLRHEVASLVDRTGVTMIYVTHDVDDFKALGGSEVVLA